MVTEHINGREREHRRKKYCVEDSKRHQRTTHNENKIKTNEKTPGEKRDNNYRKLETNEKLQGKRETINVKSYCLNKGVHSFQRIVIASFNYTESLFVNPY